MNGEVGAFVNMSEGLGGLIAEQVQCLRNDLPMLCALLTIGITVSLRSASVRRRKEVFDRDNKSKEAGHPVFILHGDLERVAVDNRDSQRYSGCQPWIAIFQPSHNGF